MSQQALTLSGSSSAGRTGCVTGAARHLPPHRAAPPEAVGAALREPGGLVRPARQCMIARSGAGMGSAGTSSAERSRERGRQRLTASCGCARAGHRRAPAGRWDFRRGLKRSPKSPDFKHRHKFYSLWCNDRGGLAPWVSERLAALDAAPAGSPKVRRRPALAPGTCSALPGRRRPSRAPARHAKRCPGDVVACLPARRAKLYPTPVKLVGPSACAISG